MPVSPLESKLAKVWATGLVLLLVATASLLVVVQGLLRVSIAGSLPLFLSGTALHLFATTSLGILLGTLTRSIPHFGLTLLMVVLPLQMLSGSITPRESMPGWVQLLMLTAPNTHYVMLGQDILYSSAGLATLGHWIPEAGADRLRLLRHLPGASGAARAWRSERSRECPATPANGGTQELCW